MVDKATTYGYTASMGILACDLTKAFGLTLAADAINLNIAPGEIYGLLGPNGAGKTTTLRMLAGLMRPSKGHAEICGFDVWQKPLEAKSRLGFMTGTTGLYERLTPFELFTYIGELYGMRPSKIKRRIDELEAMFQIGHLLHRRSGSLSTGEKQRISLSRALLHEPEVLILDEPTAGLDVLASRFVANAIQAARLQGKAILLSTHYMTEAELLCDRIGLIHQGSLLLEDTPAQFRAAMEARSLEEAFLRLITDNQAQSSDEIQQHSDNQAQSSDEIQQHSTNQAQNSDATSKMSKEQPQ